MSEEHGCCSAGPVGVQGPVGQMIQYPRTAHETRVAAIMRFWDQDVPELPTVAAETVRVLRVRLMLEEVLEYAIAAAVGVMTRDGRRVLGIDDLVVTPDPAMEPDLRLMADALGDCSVVMVGSFIAHGIRMTPVLEAVDANNYDKIARGHKDPVTGKWIKPEGHQPPNLAPILVAQGWCDPEPAAA